MYACNDNAHGLATCSKVLVGLMKKQTNMGRWLKTVMLTFL